MNTITIDIGNSRTKVETWDDDGFMYMDTEGETCVDKILDLCERRNVKGVAISTVKRDSEEFISALKKNSKCPVIVFDEEEIRKYYDLSHYQGHLGPDRMAAFLGAERLDGKSPKMIVDLGTAMTIDIADNGLFYGGNISLGLYTRLKALASSTSMLPELTELENYRLFGTDTVSAIESGAMNGILGEILYSAECAKSKIGIELTYLTGGDSEEVYIKIKNQLKCFYDPHLVGRGLDYHIRKFYLHAPIGGIHI